MTYFRKYTFAIMLVGFLVLVPSFSKAATTEEIIKQLQNQIAALQAQILQLQQGNQAFHNGDRVKTDVNLRVRSDPRTSGTLVGTVPAGSFGILECDCTNAGIKANDYTWWHIKWDNGLSGWSVEGTSEADYINKVATIKPTPSIRVVYPNGGEVFAPGTIQTIRWQNNTSIPTCSDRAQCTTIAPTYYDIKLVPYSPPCGDYYQCPTYYRAPYTIAKGVYDSSYDWSVAKYSDVNGTGQGGNAPDGSYLIQVCANGYSEACDSSDNYFKIVSGDTGGNLTPVVDGVSGPTVLSLNEVGTWTIRAHDPDGTVLGYSVDWGDSEGRIGQGQTAPAVSPTVQSATFTHSYASAGNYAIVFTVNDNSGGSAKSTLTVAVGQSCPVGRVDCAAPPQGCYYQGGNSCSCGNLVCSSTN